MNVCTWVGDLLHRDIFKQKLKDVELSRVVRSLILRWQCIFCGHRNTHWSKWHIFAFKANVQHQKKREKCAFVTVQTQGHARLTDTWWVLVWGRGGLLKKQSRAGKKEEWEHRLRRRGHWRDRVMDECRKTYWEVGEEIIFELSFVFLAKDSGTFMELRCRKKKDHCFSYWTCSVFSAAKVSSFRFSHWFSWNWRQPGFSLHLWKGWAGCGSCDYLTGSAVSENRETYRAFHSLHVWTGAKATIAIGCWTKSADLFSLTCSWVPFGLEDCISAPKVRNIIYRQHIYIFIPTEETLDVITASHQSADSELSIGINETVT